MNNIEYALQGVEQLKLVGVNYKGSGVGPYMIKFLTSIKEQRAKLNDTASVKAADDAIKAINDAK
jgi:aminopeptidase N